MQSIIVNIPTLNDNPSDFEALFLIWNEVYGYDQIVEFDFSNCYFLRPNAVAFLGGLARLIEYRSGEVVFRWHTMPNDVRTNLCQNGFAGSFSYPSCGWPGHSIPYREDRSQDVDRINPNGIMDYLTDYWLGRGWVHASDRLRDAIVGKMWEIYYNAFEHAGSKIGVFSCGQHFPQKNQLILSVIDFGQGIAANVRSYLRLDPRAEQITAASCLRWAFQSGNSTRPNGISRGLGLDILRQFIQVNNGKLEVYTNEGYALIDRNGERFENRRFSFEGTAFHITIQCDEKFYKLPKETP